MSIKAGTNINYRGPEFLDARQGMAETKADLKKWSILIPKGFKVCVDGEWYKYSPDREPDPETGYFFPEFFASNPEETKPEDQPVSKKEMQDKMDSVTKDVGDMKKELEELINTLYPLEIGSFTSNAGTYEIGQSITPTMSWSLKKRGKEVNPTIATVDGSGLGVSADYKSFTSTTQINSNHTYSVIIKAGEEQVSRTAGYTFAWKRYFGVSTQSSLNSAAILALSGSDFGTNNKLSARSFDCTGGKYPWFCIPTEIYTKSSLEVWIGGLQVTDLEISQVNVTNTYSKTTEYTCIRLKNLQTGNLNIELK